MRGRDLDRLTRSTYDLLVVGGGIYGLAIAYEAASRGLRTALVESGDFGGGTSFNHQKTAHGGLRSLQSGRIDRARESIRERRALAHIAPWLLRPLPFLVGTYRSWTRNRLALRAAFRLDAWLGRHRNRGLEPELHLPAARLVSKAATLRLFPGIRPDGLTGGAQWYDYQMVEADRLTLAFAAAADRAGADLANYAEAVAARIENGHVAGMEVRDSLTGARVTVAARATMNAAGARVGDVLQMFGITRNVPMLKATNLVTSKRASDMALAAPAASGRMLTLVPWRGRALIGTSQTPSTVTPAQTGVTEAEVQTFVAEANSAFPALHLTREDVTLVHRGIVPADVDRHGRADLKADSAILDHAREGVPGALSVIGVKYTTARGVAERAVNTIARTLGRRTARSTSAVAPLPGAAIADHEALAIETAAHAGLDVPAGTIRHLTARYAEGAAEIVKLMAEREDLSRPLADGHAAVGAEILHAIRAEMAVRLTDVVIRRTGLGAMEHPGEAVVRAAAEIAAAELGWSEARIEEEMRAVSDFYRVEE